MCNVAPCCSHRPDQDRLLPDSWTGQATRIAATTMAGEQSTNIEIQTADGDKVTLSSDISFDSAAIAYEQLGRTRAGYSMKQGLLVCAGATSSVEMTVEGSLDEQEKKEIRKVLKTLFKMVKSFLTPRPAKENSSDLSRLSSIAGVKAEFDINVSMTSAAASYARYAAKVVDVAEKPAAEQQSDTRRPGHSQRVDRLTDRMLAIVKDSGIEPARLLKRLARHLTRISAKLATATTAHWHRLRMRQEILEAFAEKLAKWTAEKNTEINAPPADSRKSISPDDPSTGQTGLTVSETMLNVSWQSLHFEIEYTAADQNDRALA